MNSESLFVYCSKRTSTHYSNVGRERSGISRISIYYISLVAYCSYSTQAFSTLIRLFSLSSFAVLKYFFALSCSFNASQLRPYHTIRVHCRDQFQVPFHDRIALAKIFPIYIMLNLWYTVR